MLKKAGIVLAAATAGVLALTPLAFAGDKHDADKHWGKGKEHTVVVHKDGDVNKDNVSNDCQFGNQTGNASSGVFGGTSLLGALAAPLTSTVTSTAGQLNTLNCTNVNVSDLVNSDSNNRTTTAEQSFVDDSFNGQAPAQP